ncbi:MAG: energy-coupling factor ABC transporter ATP-binding protein [Promethearchaeota archaeon]
MNAITGYSINTIKVESLVFSYDGSIIINKLNAIFDDNNLTVIMGPNGAGKTTFFKLLDLLLTPREGRIIVDDMDLLSLPPRQKIEWRKNVSLVFQEPFLLDLTVRKNLEYPLRLLGISKIELSKLVNDALESFKLTKIQDKKPWQLSGGDKKRVAFTQAVIRKPKLLLLDEPTASIDPENSAMIESYIMRLKKEGNTLILMATHDLFLARRIADDVGFLYHGKILEFGKNPEIFEMPKIVTTRRFITGELIA